MDAALNTPDPMVTALCEGMVRTSVPYALLVGDALHPCIQNPAFNALLVTAHAGSGGAARVWEDAALQAELATCRAIESECRLVRADLGYALYFVPLRSPRGTQLVQCFARSIAPLEEGSNGLSPYLFLTALNVSSCYVCLFSGSGEIFWLNDAVKRHLYGHTQVQQFHVDDWRQLVHPDDVLLLNSHFRLGMTRSEIAPVEYRMRDSDGNYRWLLSVSTPVLGVDGSISYWISISFDISTQRQRELAVLERERQAGQDVEHKIEQLLRVQGELATTQKMELVGNLAGGVAHDLNNLLTVISLSISLLRKTTDDDAVLRHAHTIEKAVEKAGRMATQLMTFTGRKPRTATLLDPRQLLADISDLLHKAVGDEGDFVLRCAEDALPVFVDRAYFENSLINLAVNARDATNGRGRIAMSLANTVSDRDGSTRRYLQVTVSDNGTGMNEDVRARVFEPFFTTKATGKGSGLGLPMVANFVEQAGGFIDVASEPDAGTTITLLLPAAASDAVVPDAEPVPACPGAPEGLENVLLVEDDVQVRDAMADMLHNLGYRVSTAYNPQAALHYLGAGLKVDLIISDVRMPGPVSVLDMLHVLERTGNAPPLLFITGYAGEVLVQEGLIEGRYPTLFKPFSQQELCDAIRSALAPLQLVR